MDINSVKAKLSQIKLFIRQFPFIYPSGIIYSASEFIFKSKKKIEWYRLRDFHWCIKKFDSQIIKNALPLNYSEDHKTKFRQNRLVKTYTASLFYFSGVFVFGDMGMVLTNKNRLFNEFIHNFHISNLRNSRYFSPFFSTSFKLKKEYKIAALLCSPESTNHYHWLFDTLPRIKLLEEVLDLIEIFIVPANITKNQIWTLNHLGITEERLYRIGSTEKIWFERLYIPSLPGSEGYTPLWAIDFIQQSFRVTNMLEKRKNIYLTRNDVNSRKIINEDAVISLLSKYDFEIITMSDFSFEEQIKISNSAKIVVSYHGAALSNLIFSSNCSVLEIFSPDYFRTDCFYTLANQLKLKYWYLVGSKTMNRITLPWGDIFIDLNGLQQILSDILNQEIEK